MVLLLGFVAAIAVAWISALLPAEPGYWSSWDSEFDIALAPQVQPRTLRPVLLQSRSVSVDDFVRPGMIRRYWFVHPAAGEMYDGPVPLLLRSDRDVRGSPPTWGEALAAGHKPGVPREEGFELAVGWPWPALWCSLPGSGWLRQLAPKQVEGGIAFDNAQSDAGHFRALPYRPLWSGLAIDTLCWSTFLVAARAVAIRLRARTRTRRGHCPNCGYSLAGMAPGAPCPECGSNAPADICPPAPGASASPED